MVAVIVVDLLRIAMSIGSSNGKPDEKLVECREPSSESVENSLYLCSFRHRCNSSFDASSGCDREWDHM